MTVKKKLLIVGPGCIGKTSLLQATLQGRYPPIERPFETVPGIVECGVLTEAGEKTHVKLELWDTAGTWEYDRLRPLTYPNTSVIVVAYAIDRPDYFELTENVSLPTVDHHVPGVPIILCGLRKDSRDDPDSNDPRKVRFISTKIGERMARRIGAFAFVECSSFTGEAVKEVFEAAARAALFGPLRKAKRKKKWSVGRATNCVVL